MWKSLKGWKVLKALNSLRSLLEHFKSFGSRRLKKSINKSFGSSNFNKSFKYQTLKSFKIVQEI